MSQETQGTSSKRSSSKARKFARVLGVIVLMSAVLAIVNHNAGATASKPMVYVSLTWDDGRASQVNATEIQSAHGFPATYYINSGLVDSSPYNVSRQQLDAIAAAGNEIGGHTQFHENLTSITPDAATATVCNDRSTLVSWYGEGAGRSFAYPYGANNAAVKQIVQSCGYTSARGVTGVMTPTACSICRPAESLPSVDPWQLATPTSVGSSTTLADLQFQVTQASLNGGGWVIYVMHDIGKPGDSLNIDPALYSTFLDWLAGRSDVSVRTVGDLMTSDVVSPPAAPTSPLVTSVRTPVTVRNAEMEADLNADRVADCFTHGGFGTNSASWSRSTDAHSGVAAEQVAISSFTNGDRKVLPTLDAGTANGGCAPSVDSAHAYEVSLWYRSTAATRLVVYARDAAGAWSYWATGPELAASSGWSQTVYATGPLPAGTTALSWGVSLASVGTVVVDDFAMSSVELTQPTSDAYVGNASLESDANRDGVPDCFTTTGYGTSTFSFARVPDAHSGYWGERLSVTSLSSGDRKTVLTMDRGRAAGGCAMDVTSGAQYRLGVWYHSTVPTMLNVYLRDTTGAWRWWASMPYAASAAQWTQVGYVTRPVPSWATGLSFGLGLGSVGVVVTDDYSFTPIA